MLEALTLVVAQVDKVTLLELLELGLYRPRAVLAEPEVVPQLQELRLELQQVLALLVVALVVAVGKAQDVIHVLVIVVAAVRVVINHALEPLDAGKALHHSPLVQMVHMVEVEVAVVLVTIAMLAAAVSVFY